MRKISTVCVIGFFHHLCPGDLTAIGGYPFTDWGDCILWNNAEAYGWNLTVSNHGKAQRSVNTAHIMTFCTPDISRPGYVITIIADALAPNRYQNISIMTRLWVYSKCEHCAHVITFCTPDISRPGYVITMVADALAPNRHQDISIYHADSTMIILSHWIIFRDVTAIKQTMFERR